MKAKLGPVYLLAFAGLAAVVAGCSSGGLGGPVASGTDSASGQVACALFIQQWGQTLWGLVTSQTGGQRPTLGKPVQHYDPDTGEPDYIALEITFADGSWQLVKQLTPEFDGVSKTTINYDITSSAGLMANYTVVIDDKGTQTEGEDDTFELAGTSVLPDGKTQDFEAFTEMQESVNYEQGATVLESRQSDGSTFTIDMPLGLNRVGETVPDFSRTATGTYTSPDFNIVYELDSTTVFPSRWAALSTDFQGGVTGRFSLGPDFSGSGRLLQDSQAFALLSWTPTGKTRLNYLSAGSGAASPAGAAVDYLTHRWLTLQAAMGPAPGVSGVSGYIKLPL
jgi:hypothetical protein